MREIRSRYRPGPMARMLGAGWWTKASKKKVKTAVVKTEGRQGGRRGRAATMDHPMPGQPMFGVASESGSGAGGRVHADPPPRRVAGGADDLPSTLLLVGGAGEIGRAHV